MAKGKLTHMIWELGAHGGGGGGQVFFTAQNNSYFVGTLFCFNKGHIICPG